MKSFPETGYSSYESSALNSLVQSSPSLLQQMSQLHNNSAGGVGGAGGAGGAVGGSQTKFPELSITKHESKTSESSALQIIPRTTSSMMETTGAYHDANRNMDIQDQINMLRTMPDIMKMNNTSNTEEMEELSGEDCEEDGSPLHQEEDRGLHVSGHVDTSITTP